MSPSEGKDTGEPVSSPGASPIRQRGPEWITCATCGARWTGLRAAHCGATECHQTFTGISAFDKHRKGGRCHNPAEVDLVLVTKPYWSGWGYPGERPSRGEE